MFITFFRHHSKHPRLNSDCPWIIHKNLAHTLPPLRLITFCVFLSLSFVHSFLASEIRLIISLFTSVIIFNNCDLSRNNSLIFPSVLKSLRVPLLNQFPSPLFHSKDDDLERNWSLQSTILLRADQRDSVRNEECNFLLSNSSFTRISKVAALSLSIVFPTVVPCFSLLSCLHFGNVLRCLRMSGFLRFPKLYHYSHAVSFFLDLFAVF